MKTNIQSDNKHFQNMAPFRHVELMLVHESCNHDKIYGHIKHVLCSACHVSIVRQLYYYAGQQPLMRITSHTNKHRRFDA